MKLLPVVKLVGVAGVDVVRSFVAMLKLAEEGGVGFAFAFATEHFAVGISEAGRFLLLSALSSAYHSQDGAT